MEQHTLPHLLIVEDDEHINTMIFEGLTAAHYRCSQAFSGSEGKLYLEREAVDLVILDLMLPGLTGEQLIREIKGASGTSVPVIVLSAKDQLDHKLDLFQLGADDYVTKPFALAELIARIGVHLKRSAAAPPLVGISRYRGLTIDPAAYMASVDGHPLQLTRREFTILELLVKHPTRVFSKRDLYELAWDEIYMGEDKTVNVHISNIRAKLRTFSEEDYIDTVWGIGFRLHP
ncbi:response regulator transcription factor [Paenibacillus daejeonensis]|uniref:response regulator transcription factor n=1 Tax=Paenibacillus daejeonensis TaxID=135193 RepID=UPI00035DF858|nr:response regulator transcription factor [Paenibacillus daejeonensis]